jgi:hypothetical protein
VNETVALLAARPPKLRKAVRDAEKADYAYVVLDGTLLPLGRSTYCRTAKHNQDEKGSVWLTSNEAD